MGKRWPVSLSETALYRVTHQVNTHDGRIAWQDGTVCARGALQHTGESWQRPLAWREQIRYQTWSDSWSLSSDFRYRSGYLHLLPSKLSLWKEYGAFLTGQVLQRRRDEAPVCFRMRTHTATLTDCVHIQSWEGLLMHLLFTTIQSGWGRNGICTRAFYTVFASAGAKQLMYGTKFSEVTQKCEFDSIMFRAEVAVTVHSQDNGILGTTC